jgi:O-antigen ligase
VPLVIAPGLLFYYDVTPKAIILLFAAALWLAFAPHARIQDRAVRWFAGLAAAQALSLVVSAMFAADLALAFTGTAWRRQGVVMECAVLAFTLLLAANPGMLRPVLRWTAAAGLLAAIYGICQFAGFDPILPPQSYRVGEGIWTIVRPPSTLGNANYFAGYLIYACFYAAALFASEAPGFWKYCGAIACAVDSVAIVLSGTRAAILGLVIGAVFLAIACGPRWRRAAVAFAAIALVALAALYVSPAGAPLRARVRWSREDPLGGGRLVLWRDSTRMFASQWAAGFGPEQFGRQFPRFQSVALARAYPDFYQESPHNMLLDAAVAQGLPGLALAALWIVLGFYAAWRTRNTQAAVVACLAAALAGGVLSAQFSSPVLTTRLYELSTVALLCGPLTRRPREQTVFALRASCRAASAVFLAFAIALLATDLRARAFQRSVEKKDAAQAAARYRDISELALPGFAIDLYASRSLAQLSSLPAAIRAAERATRTSEDRQNAFFYLAQLRARQNDIAATEQNLRAAIAVAPNWFKPHWVLAELLRRTDRIPEARSQIRLAWERDGGKDPEVRRTWEALGSPR